MLSNPWLPTATVQGSEEIIEVVSEYENEEKTEKLAVHADGDGFFYQVRAVREALSAGRKRLERPA
eukprot:Awhi_evm1s8404